MNYTFQVYLLGSDQREAFLKIKTHLVSKAALCTSAGTVRLVNAVVQNMCQQIQVLSHARKLIRMRIIPGADVGKL